MNELPSPLERERQIASQRVDTIAHIIRVSLRNGFIKNEHLSGDIINCGANTGAVEEAIRAYGGRFTSIERDRGLLRMAVDIGFLKPKIDTIIHGDALAHLQQHSEEELPVDMVSFLGAGEWYFHDPDAFYDAAMSCLKPGGVFLMTGIRSTWDMFHAYEQKFGGSVFAEGIHAWDEYGYCIQKVA